MADPVSVVVYTAAAVATIEAVRKVVVNRGVGHEISRDYVAVGLALIGVSLAAGAPATMAWSDEVTGIHNLAFLVHGIAAMATMVCVAGFLRTLERVRIRLRTAIALCAVWVVALVALYLARGAADPDFGASSDRHPASIAYSVLYLAYMTFWLVLFIRGLWLMIRGEERTMQLALLLAAGGLALCLAGLLWKIALVIQHAVDPVQAPRGTHGSLICQAVGVVLFAAGSAFAAAVRRLAEYRDRRRRAGVHKLWVMLEPVRQESALCSREGLPTVQQQMMDIFDARLLLRAYRPPGLRTMLAELAPARELHLGGETVLAEAVELRVALDCFRDGTRYPQAGNGTQPRRQASSVPTDEAREIGWLAQLADTVDTATVVDVAQRIHRQLRHDEDTTAR